MKPMNANELLAGLTLARPAPITARGAEKNIIMKAHRRVKPTNFCVKRRGYL